MRNADNPNLLNKKRKLEESISQNSRSKDDKGKHKKGNMAKFESKVNSKKGLDEEKNPDKTAHREPRKEEPQNSEEVIDLDTELKFSTFDFSTGRPLPSYLAKRRAPLNVLLKKAEAQKKELEDLKKNQRDQIHSKKVFEKLLQKAQGEKIRDNPTLLKKTMKRKQKQKAKSAAQWKERKDTVTRHQQEKQQKRTENIRNRKLNKGKKAKDQKPTRKERKEGNRPGFEGKRKSFLNQKK